jgi:hypothetical protein
LAGVGGAVAYRVAQSGGIDQHIGRRILFEIGRDQPIALGLAEPGNGGARCIGGQLLDRMGGTEINALGQHAGEHEQEDRGEDGKFNDGRAAPVLSQPIAEP